MRDIAEVVVAVAFALPKVDAEFGAFVGAIGEEIFDEAKYNHFTDLKFEVFPGKVHFVVCDERQHALFVGWQLYGDINPIQFH
jgi:hypothetical protein